MKRRLLAGFAAIALIIGSMAPAAYAGSTGTNVALGLASFAVFNQLAGAFVHPRPVHREVVATHYAPPPQVVVVQARPQPTVVQYPNGRYELRGDGVYVPYQWVWIPNAPMIPPVPPPPPTS
jgi:hypothetical protein